MLQFLSDTHKWVKEDIHNMLEEHPEYENMSDEELIKKRNDLYWEAQGCFDRGYLLENEGDTIVHYVEIRKKMVERR